MDVLALLVIGAVLYAVILPFAQLVVAMHYGKNSRADALGWLVVGAVCLVGVSFTIPAQSYAASVMLGALPWIPHAAAPVSTRVSALLASIRG